ncbi:single-strand DNA-binding protein [Salinibacter ruber]|uniref:single-stranded DNA-binding protein n=2 Tax=Salinibacter ruber TaxID=146919 RepID=UPI00216A2664|nr:single-stranded DNA-binding protein [Salinibacter ruber]MCS3831236.1 single-strand DNA-binding protein [Salinibacter ruber]
MRGLNKLQIIGHLGSDPELRYTGSGTAVANLSVATDAPMKDDPEWHSVTCWGDLAEIVDEHLSKGERIYAEGPVETRQWEDPDGNTRHTTELHADEVLFLGAAVKEGGRPPGEPDPTARETAGAGNQNSGQETFEPDDELPF